MWKKCQALYKYQYHLKLDPEEEEPFYFIYGTIVHKIAEEYCIAEKKKTIGEITESVLNGQIPIETDKEGKNIFAPTLPNEYKARLPEHLKSIVSLTDKLGTSGYFEYEFNYDLDPPNNKLVRGYIDRLINLDDQWIIIDYKTTKKGRWRKNKTNITNDLQLRTYARVIQKNFNVKAENIMAALYYLEGGNLIGAKFSEKSILDAEKELLTAYDQIKSTDEASAWGNVGEWCSRCAYRKICPFVKST